MPDEYSASDKKLLERARKGLKEAIDRESPVRAQMSDDLRFCTLDQWPADIRADREGDLENGPRPCLTIDKINQYIVQVVNDMRLGRPGIVVRPQDDASDPDTAKILKGLIRNIEDQSSADIVYATAGENAAKIGLGFFRIVSEYVSPDSFDQELFLRSVPNSFSVYLGLHYMPDGSDAEEAWVIEQMPVEKFRAEWPQAKSRPEHFTDVPDDQLHYWTNEETVTVVEYYCFKRHEEKLHYLADGSMIAESDYEAWPALAGARPEILRSRQSVRRQLMWSKMTGAEILDKRELPGRYIPVGEVIGREAWVDGRRILWGLVRPAKDSLRMYNYFASTLTERMGLAPRVPFVGAKGQFEGLEDRWRKANRTNLAYLEYNPIDVAGNALPRPQREGAIPMEAALLAQMRVIEHDVQTSLGMFKAAIGESESQQSGRAILALQRESDTGIYHFGANLAQSIRHAGRILVDLIPHYYDTRRIVRILGEDGQAETVRIDPAQQRSMIERRAENGAIERIYNPGVGKYDVSVTVGPSYNTRRMEAAAVFTELAKGASDPISAAVMRYLTVRHSDFTGADEAALMLRALLPPTIQAVGKSEQLPPQALAQIAQLQQAGQQLQQKFAETAQENVQLKAGAQVEMQKIAARQQEAQAQFALQKQKQDGELQLQRERAEAEIALKRAIAVADLEIEKMKLNAAADADVDTAIAKVKSMVMLHEAKMQGAIENDAASREAGEALASGEQSMVAMQSMHKAFLDGVGQIVESLQAKKTVNLLKREGQIVGAEVTVA